jgi:hypothetical protein
MATPEVEKLWQVVVEKVKVRLVMPPLWRAMEGCRPLVVEDGMLVLAFPPSTAHGASLLVESKNQNIIERVLEETAGQPLRLKVIHGETMADWEEEKKRGAASAQLQAAATERRRREAAAGQGWDAIAEQLSRRYAETPLRQLPHVQAVYLDDAVGVLAEAVQRLMSTAEVAEPEQRAYARTLDKVAERAQVPATLVAWLVRQRLARGGQ